MQSTNFKFNKHNTFRVINEETPKKKTNWDRIIYFIVLISILGVGGYTLINRKAFIHAQGQVYFKKVDVQLIDDIRIIKYFKNEGDVINEGDTLFSYKPEQSSFHHTGNSETSITVTPASKNIALFEQQILKTEKDISLKNIELKSISKQLLLEEKNYEKTKKAVILDIYPASKLHPIEINIEDYSTAKQGLKKQISYLYAYLKKLKSNLKTENSLENEYIHINSGGYRDNLLYQIAPIHGTITRKLKEEHEVALKTDLVMTIHSPEKIYVKAFFKTKDLEHVHINDEVTIKFPDGNKSKGKILRFYTATYVLPEEFQKNYEPVHRTIAADIVPLNETDLNKWEKNYKMEVSVSKPIF